MRPIIIFILLILSSPTFADYTINGKLPAFPNQEINLQGLKIDPFLIDSTTSDAEGNFSLQYPDDYTGTAQLQIKNQALNLLLHQENFSINMNQENTGVVVFEQSLENQIFIDFVKLSNSASSKINAWRGVARLYDKTTDVSKYIQGQILALKQKMTDFKQQIDPKLYVDYYSKMYDKIEQMPNSAGHENYLALIDQHHSDFNELDFNDPLLINSGLLPKLLRSYYLLLESLLPASQYPPMNASTDHLLQSLENNPALLEKTSLFLWDYLERRSSFKAAEHLSNVMLDKYQADKWQPKSRGRFERYRQMTKGQTAPDIVFSDAKRLSEITADYKVIMFWQSDCKKCIKELDALNKLYPWFEKNNVAFLTISLDTDKAVYQQSIKDYKFPVYNDFKGWQNQAVKDYLVYKTPTFFLVDDKQTMLTKHRITSAQTIEAFLKQWLAGK